jgi:hypothetical protein
MGNKYKIFRNIYIVIFIALLLGILQGISQIKNNQYIILPLVLILFLQAMVIIEAVKSHKNLQRKKEIIIRFSRIETNARSIKNYKSN